MSIGRIVLFLALVALALAPGSARAHATIVSSQPQPGQELTSAPDAVVLTFTEPINARLSRATVTAPDGRRFEGLASGRQEIQVQLSTDLPGFYTVAWTTVSTLDGHTLRGTFQFGVRVAPGAGAEGSTAFAPRRADLLVAVARMCEYLALLMAIGLVVLQGVARRDPPLAWLRRRLRLPLAAALVSGVAVVVGEALAAAPAPSAAALASYLTTGVAGAARLSRLVAEALALALSLVAARAAVPLLAAAIVSLAAAGHAAAVRPAWWGITAAAVHLIAAGLWAGGILALTTLRPPGGWRGAEGRALLDRFSPVALAGFAITAGFGVIRGSQELGAAGDLLTSSYGRVLGVKALAVLAMLPLSLLAWRRRFVAPRVEATVALFVVGAAALLAAYPLPPGRLRDADAARAPAPTSSAPSAATAAPVPTVPTVPARSATAAPSASAPSGVPATSASPSSSEPSALPQEGDLTLGGNAGQVLVGLTLRPGQPGRNDVLVYLVPPGGEDAAVSAELMADGRVLDLRHCGATCRSAALDLAGGERLEVRVAGAEGGTARFDLPTLPAPDGADLFKRAQDRMDRLRTFRMDELLGPAEPPLRATYAFQAPDRMRIELSTGDQLVWVGKTRYLRLGPDADWQAEDAGTVVQVPSFTWDSQLVERSVAPRLLGRTQVEGINTQVMAFWAQIAGTPIWFRLWVDAEGLIRRVEMRADGHFMDQRYYDFDAPFTIEPPVGEGRGRGAKGVGPGP